MLIVLSAFDGELRHTWQGGAFAFRTRCRVHERSSRCELGDLVRFRCSSIQVKLVSRENQTVFHTGTKLLQIGNDRLVTFHLILSLLECHYSCSGVALANRRPK
jgi:hypothetical protein